MDILFVSVSMLISAGTSSSVDPHSTNPLRFVDYNSTKSKQWIFLPIEDPLQVEVVDTDGDRIVFGELSNLAVKVVARVKGEVEDSILSKDSPFNLRDGIGTFQGSVMKMKTGVSLMFQVMRRCERYFFVLSWSVPCGIAGFNSFLDFLENDGPVPSK